MSILKGDFQSELRSLGILMFLSFSRLNANLRYTFFLRHLKLYFFWFFGYTSHKDDSFSDVKMNEVQSFASMMAVVRKPQIYLMQVSEKIYIL